MFENVFEWVRIFAGDGLAPVQVQAGSMHAESDDDAMERSEEDVRLSDHQKGRMRLRMPRK